MIQYSVRPRVRIFVKGYGCLSFAENTDTNICKNINKMLSGKYSLKLLDHAKQSATDTLKTFSKRFIQKTAETTVDLIGNKIANNITEFQKIRKKTIER